LCHCPTCTRVDHTHGVCVSRFSLRWLYRHWACPSIMGIIGRVHERALISHLLVTIAECRTERGIEGHVLSEAPKSLQSPTRERSRRDASRDCRGETRQPPSDRRLLTTMRDKPTWSLIGTFVSLRLLSVKCIGREIGRYTHTSDGHTPAQPYLPNVD
jgi:hypothetical protein